VNDVPWYVSLIVAWLPFLILIGLVVWMTLTLRTALRTKDRRSLAEAVDGYARELRRSNDRLEQATKGQPREFDAPRPPP
jgi:Flp pilus assembly protein TadB